MFHVNLRSEGRLCIEAAHLVVDVLAIVHRHLHSSVVVLQRAVTHLKSFLANRGGAPQVSLVTLILQNGLLPELNSVLLLELFDHAFQKFKLQLLFLDHGLDFGSDPLPNLAFVHAISSDLGVQLHVSEGTHHEASSVEIIAKLLVLVLMGFLSRPGTPVLPDSLQPAATAPVIDPSID